MAAKAPTKETLEIFTWEGLDKSGKRVKGEQPGKSETLVKAQLRQQGIKPVKVRKKPKPLFGARKKKITTKDIAVFSRQLATMLAAGVPLVQAFDIVGRGHENPSMQELLLGIKADIEAGSTLTEALRKHPLYFDDLFCNLVEAGERAGVLETLLDKIATYKEKTESLKAKVKKALTYPAAVVVVACIVTAILLIFVVPQFEELFKGFGADLPAFTQLVIEMSRFMQANWYYLLGALVAAVFGFNYVYKRSQAFRHFLDRMFLRIPIIGPQILHKSAIARFARTLATMSAAGVPLVEALESVAGAAGNAVYSDAILEIREQVATGQQLQQAMRQTNLFPHMVVQMVAIGEESGSIDSMLSKVADFYEEEVDNAVDNLSSLMEPMIMAFLGIVVGGLVVAMYLPIFKLGSVV
ncbi:type IV pilus assembly protein PilC [Methylomarinovum caldicuralii]|uniref:Type IV pilus assembly protein PilC n=1 Tax=Methylomarinovum caldicuralii TaxID=438856 RepID=A0AAU9C5X6_9GAMM|nr:type II secretion system F family protein [Methylomarinovum caldicuralii]BCX82665.1 type IV pilus assembly protein PilC [Methylomarinovum caldicuralii]